MEPHPAADSAGCSSNHGQIPAVAITQFPIKLVSRRMVAPTVAHLSFVRDDGQPLDFIPGQFNQIIRWRRFTTMRSARARRSKSR
jgi:hypothetical protein